MKIVTVGTGMIVEEFIKAAKQVNTVEIIGSYSRSLDRAKEFSAKMGIVKFYDSLSTIVDDEDVDAIYIASPNSLHFMQAKYFLENHKHVILEKPIMSKVANAKSLLDIAKKNNLFIFEAISNIHTPNFEVIKENISKLGNIKMVQSNYSQYSSRFDLFKAGEVPNVFNPAFSGGALLDLNIYNIQLIYHLFGLPKDSTYFPNIMKGIDTSGILVMDYGEFKAFAVGAKDSASPSYFTIQGDEGFITATGPTNELPNLHLKTKDEEFKVDHNTKHRLYWEIEVFGDIFSKKDYDLAYKKFEESIDVLGILEKSWKQNYLGFEDRTE